jgi:hypothetical protein
MNDFIKELEKRLDEYEKVIQTKKTEGLMLQNTVKTYLTHSRNFVRWCKGEFMPGDKNK